MKPPVFEYHLPTSVTEALDLLGSLGSEAKVLAGGQSLLPVLSLRLSQPANLVDINKLAELGTISAWDGGVAIGATVRQRAAERSALVKERVPLLAEALPYVGHAQIRNRGTVCGSLAHADPAAELPALALALDAQLVARSTRGERIISAADFFHGYLTTALEPEELLAEVRFPGGPSGAGWSFQEVSRRHGDFALVGVACGVALDADARVTEARIALTGCGAGPLRARAAEQLVRGQTLSPDALSSAAESAAREIDPTTDVHASAAYRRHLASVLVKRALGEAAQRARG